MIVLFVNETGRFDFFFVTKVDWFKVIMASSKYKHKLFEVEHDDENNKYKNIKYFESQSWICQTE